MCRTESALDLQKANVLNIRLMHDCHMTQDKNGNRGNNTKTKKSVKKCTVMFRVRLRFHTYRPVKIIPIGRTTPTVCPKPKGGRWRTVKITRPINAPGQILPVRWFTRSIGYPRYNISSTKPALAASRARNQIGYLASAATTPIVFAGMPTTRSMKIPNVSISTNSNIPNNRANKPSFRVKQRKPMDRSDWRSQYKTTATTTRAITQKHISIIAI